MDLGKGHTPLIIAKCRQEGVLRNQCAYILATAWHETLKYRYMREIWGPTAAQKRYEGRKDLGNTIAGDGKKFLGRGFVQITGRRNYTDWGRRLGLDLLKEPTLAEKPEVAVRILVEGMMLGTFTGRKLPDYVHLYKSDFFNARRVVNGKDKADLIAGYAEEFDKALLAARYSVDDPLDRYEREKALQAQQDAQRKAQQDMLAGKIVLTPSNSTPAPQTPPAATPAPATGFAAVIAALLSIFKGAPK